MKNIEWHFVESCFYEMLASTVLHVYSCFKFAIDSCRELGISIVPYSPLGRGFFGNIKLEDLSENDFRKVSINLPFSESM